MVWYVHNLPNWFKLKMVPLAIFFARGDSSSKTITSWGYQFWNALRFDKKWFLACALSVYKNILYNHQKDVSTYVCYPFCWLRRKVSTAKRKYIFLQILEPSTLRPNFQTRIWISNFVGAKFSFGTSEFCFGRQLGSSLGLNIPQNSSEGFLFVFPIGVY